ncbi:MAG: bifunctional 4'-phosphopantothenoylcysteine decarboxylase/phosphopantothenoylcysteine synthetase, partial [Candidatus Omnitrophica bacterium]|nr:bifunctional 4'-phosphopantothenoylcysteine decarboxylase/phosphopantothenoylcysteine synthetase [Candidatus Omnitrophota bacterium]
MFKDSKILVGITGSIAAYKVYDLIRLLRRNGAEVRCVVTHAGMHFVNKLTLETLLNHRIYTDLFDEYADKRAVHVPLADWADVVVVVPATADILAKVSVGIADELLTSVILATQANVLF